MANKTPQIVKCITISSSEDENDGMPKIIDAVSLRETQGQALRKYDIFNVKTRNTVATRQFPTRAINNNTRLAPAGSRIDPIRKPVMTRQAPVQATVIRKPIITNPVLKPTTPQPSTSRPNTSEHKRIKPTTIQVHNISKKTEAPITISDSNGNAVLFQKFRSACQKLGTVREVTTKICEKVERAYSSANPEYISSESFKTLLKTSIHGILNSSGSKPWHIVRSVVVELKHHKLSKKNKTPIDSEKGKTNPVDYLGEGTSKDVAGTSKETGNDVGEAAEGEDDEEEMEITDPKKRRQVRKLSHALRKVDRRIKQLEEREIELDDMDDEDSAYIKLDRYKAHFAKIYNKYCELTNKPSDAERTYLRKVSFSGSQYPEINRCLEMFYNKNRQFPDFQDVKKLVQKVNVTKKMRWPPIKIHDIAEKTFKEFGEMLKRLRQFDDYEVLTSYLVNKDDPAKKDSDLRQKLHENAVLNKKREQEVIDSFAKKQLEHIEQEKLSDTSDSNTQSSEIDSDSENENYRMSHEASTSNFEPFKDDFKSDEEINEDPRFNFYNYLALKPNVENKDSGIKESINTNEGCMSNVENKDSGIKESVNTNEGCLSKDNKNEDNGIKGVETKEVCMSEDDKDMKMKSINPDVSKHLYKYICSEAENNNSGCKRKISLLSSDENSDAEYKMSYKKKKKRRSTDRSSEDEMEKLHFQNILREDKKGKSRIKRIKLLDEIISSDDSCKKRNITLSINDSSDGEVENVKTTEIQQADENKINLLNKNSVLKDSKLMENESFINVKEKVADSEHKQITATNTSEEEKVTSNEHNKEEMITKDTEENILDSKHKEKPTKESAHNEKMIIDNDGIKEKTTDCTNVRKKITYNEDKKENITQNEEKSKQISDNKHEDKNITCNQVEEEKITKQEEMADKKCIEKHITNNEENIANKETSVNKFDEKWIGNNKQNGEKIAQNSDDKQEITDEKHKEKNITHSQHSEDKISDREGKSGPSLTINNNFVNHKTSDDNSSVRFMKKKIELLPEFSDSDESEKNEDSKKINKKKIKLSTDDSSEDEKYYKRRREQKNVLHENKLLNDQEYFLSRSNTITMNRRIKKVRVAKKVVVTPISCNARRNKTRNLSNSRSHKGTESEQDDDFYKISAHNLHRNRIRSSASNSPAPSIADSIKSGNSIATSDGKTKNLPKSLKDEHARHLIISCNSSERNNNSEDEITDTVNNAGLEIKSENSVKDCASKTDLVVKESIKSEEKINDDVKIELKMSDSNESSEEKESPMALEDSDYGVDEQEDSDEITPKKFIIKKTILPISKDSNNSSSSNPIKMTTHEKKLKLGVAKKLNRDDENSDSSVQSKTSVKTKEDSDSSDLDESVVIISEDILDQPCPDKTNVNESKEKILPCRFSDKKSHSIFKDSSSDSDLNEAIKLCEVKISDSEPEALNIDDESSDLSDSSAKKPTQVVQPTKRRKEPTPELCIIMETKTSKPSSTFQRGGSMPERPVVQNLVGSMPIRKPAVNPLIRQSSKDSLARKLSVHKSTVNTVSMTSAATSIKTSSTRTINPHPVVRQTPMRPVNPTINRRRGFNPLISSTPVKQPILNRNIPEKVIPKKVYPASQKKMFVDSSSKGPTVRPNRTQSQSSNAVQINRKVLANGVQINTNTGKVLHQTAPRRQQLPKVVPVEEEIIVLD